MILRSARFVVPSFLAAILFSASVSADPILWIDDSSGVLGKVDVATGAVTIVGNMGVALTDIAFDPSGNLYGIDFGSLYSIDKTTAAVTLIGNTGTSLNSLVFSAGGTLYAANTSLYSLNTTTGAATAIGSGGGYSSSGDLAFVGGSLYLSSTSPASDTLFTIDTGTGAGTAVGAIGTSGVYGLASSNNVNLFGAAGTEIYSIDPTTGAGTALVGYGGHGLGDANGTAFFSEAGAVVPEPQSVALFGVGVAALTVVRRTRRS